MKDERILVYSTDGGLPLPEPIRPAHARGAAPPDDGVVRVLRERRRASTVTLVYGLTPREVEAIGKELRKRCSTGGTAKSGVVELQGDHREAVVGYFAERGRRAKRAGG